MLNYFNFKKFGNDYLLTNDTGKYAFVNSDTFNSLISENPIGKDDYEMLKENFFIYDEHEAVFSERIKHHIRGSKSYLFSAAVLHIFVLTNICNMSCIYCQAKDDTSIVKSKMTEEIAKRSVDIALSSPARHMVFEFQGGEPLANFDVLKYIIEYTNIKKGSKHVEYNLVSNLTLMTDEILDFLLDNNVSISTSLDGDENVHNLNRRFSDNRGTYKCVKDMMDKITQRGGSIGAIQTTTRHSLPYYKEIIDEYVKCGQTDIFIRPLTNLGTAKRVWNEIGYTAGEFLEYYEKSLKYIIKLNQSGTDIQEKHAVIFLKKILDGYSENYMELRSPCGAGIGQIAYFYDGNIFTCDEGRMFYEMGNDAFKMGNVFESTYSDLVHSEVCRAMCASSFLEGQVKCCDCVYQPYCGVCPVINLAQEGDLFFKDKKNFRCSIYGGMLDIIFSIIHENKNEELYIFKKWIGVD